jgi:hypothetical protein
MISVPTVPTGHHAIAQGATLGLRVAELESTLEVAR